MLLLDEPDNHLDLPGKLYLEKLIHEYPGAVVIVSHDRYLLDAVVTHIAEIEDGKLTTFAGDYTSYILDKEERLARQEELFQCSSASINASKTRSSAIRHWVLVNDKFASRLKAMRTQLDRFEQNKLDQPVLERRRMDLQLKGWRGSNKVLELARAEQVVWTAQRLFEDVDQVIRHGERVGLIGPNGAGKSVLLRLVLGMEPSRNGRGDRLGPSVKTGYYAQEHETLDPGQTVIDAVRLPRS